MPVLIEHVEWPSDVELPVFEFRHGWEMRFIPGAGLVSQCYAHSDFDYVFDESSMVDAFHQAALHGLEIGALSRDDCFFDILWERPSQMAIFDQWFQSPRGVWAELTPSEEFDQWDSDW